MADSKKQVAIDITADPSGFIRGMEQASTAVTTATAQIDAKFKTLGDSFGAVHKQLLAFTAVIAGGGALKKFIDDANNWNSEATKMAKLLGITTESASVLNVALKHIGVDSETYISASEKLSKNIQGNAQAFQVLGVRVQEANGQYRPVVEVMGEVNEKLAAIKNPIEQNIAGQQVYGKGWSEVRGILKLTAEGMADADKRARELGLIVGPDGAAMSKKYTEQMRDLKLVGDSLAMQFGNVLVPVFTNLGSTMLQNVNPTAKALTEVLKTLVVLGRNVSFVFTQMAKDIDTSASAFIAMQKWDMSGARAMLKARAADAAAARALLDLEDNKTMNGPSAGGGRGFINPPMAAAPEGPHYKFKEKGDKAGPGDESQMAKWQTLLAEKKAAIDQQAVMDGNFHQMSKEEERKYWQDILATIDVNSRDGQSVRKKIADETQAIRKAEYGSYIESLNNERDELQKNYAQRTEVAVKAYQNTASLYGEQSKEAKKAYGDVLAEHRKFVEQTQALDAVASDKRRNKQLADVELDRVQMQQDLDLGLISNLQALARELQFEERLTAIRKAALEERRALLIGTDKDPVAVAQLQAQIEQLEQQHQQRMGQIKGAVQKDAFAPLVNIYKAAETAIAASITGILNRTMTLKQGMAAAWKGISQSVISEISAILAKKLAAWAVDKGLALASIGTKAAVAGSGAASSVASIPFVGPVLAIAAMAAVFGAVMGMKSNVPSAAGGYDIPASVNPLTQLHEREMVLPARYADVIRQLADGSNGNSQSSSTSAMPTIELRGTHMPGGFFMAHADDIAAAVKKASRNGAFWAK